MMNPAIKVMGQALTRIRVLASLLHSAGLASDEYDDCNAVGKMIEEYAARALEVLDEIELAEADNDQQTQAK